MGKLFIRRRRDLCMIIGLRRSILLGTVGGVAAIIILLPLMVGLAFPLPSQLPVTNSNIKVIDRQDETITLEVSLDVFNPNYGALAVSKVEYGLFANGEFVGKGELDYSNIPVTGRPQLLQRQTTTLVSIVTINSDSIADLEDVFWKSSGTIEISNAFVTGQRDFTAYFQ
jgi:hypothetical protein